MIESFSIGPDLNLSGCFVLVILFIVCINACISDSVHGLPPVFVLSVSPNGFLLFFRSVSNWFDLITLLAVSLKADNFEGLRFDFSKGLNQKFSLSHRLVRLCFTVITGKSLYAYLCYSLNL